MHRSQSSQETKRAIYAKYGLTPPAWCTPDADDVPEGLGPFCDHLFHIRDLTAKAMEPLFDPILR